ncbi:MAG: TrkA family potassium uptake protein [Acidobacteriota bacterium]|nr:MAG: TrkA family potassium uptake protein [Acidobacteriota bacterium]
MKRFVVVGLGNFGAAVAETLQAIGHEVAALDRQAERVDAMASLVTRAAVGDGTDIRTLRRLGADAADAAIISTGDDITASAMTTLMMRDLKVEEIYVKVASPDHARLIEKIGVTETIFPERESGVRLAKRISTRLLLTYVQLGLDFGLQEMAVPESWIGKSLRELELPRRHGISVVAVHDVLTNRFQPVLDPDAPLKDSDTLIVAGTDAKLNRASRLK